MAGVFINGTEIFSSDNPDDITDYFEGIASQIPHTHVDGDSTARSRDGSIYIETNRYVREKERLKDSDPTE